MLECKLRGGMGGVITRLGWRKQAIRKSTIERAENKLARTHNWKSVAVYWGDCSLARVGGERVDCPRLVEELLLAAAQTISEPALCGVVEDGEAVEERDSVLGKRVEVFGERIVDTRARCVVEGDGGGDDDDDEGGTSMKEHRCAVVRGGIGGWANSERGIETPPESDS